jgi:hypothetical protein
MLTSTHYPCTWRTLSATLLFIHKQLEMEKLSLRNEHKRDTDRRMRDIEAEMKDLQAKQSELTEIWDKERGAVGKVMQLIILLYCTLC